MAALFGAPYLRTRTVHPDTCSCLPRHSSTTEWRPISRPTYCRLVGLGERNTAQSCVILMFGRRRWDVGPLVGVACLEPVGLGIDSTRKGNAMKRVLLTAFLGFAALTAAAALAAYLMESGRGHEVDLPKGAKLEIELERALYLAKE